MVDVHAEYISVHIKTKNGFDFVKKSLLDWLELGYATFATSTGPNKQ